LIQAGKRDMNPIRAKHLLFKLRRDPPAGGKNLLKMNGKDAKE